MQFLADYTCPIHGINPLFCLLFLQVKSAFEASMVWSESQMDRGLNPQYEPCAKPGCSPFPACCTTNGVNDVIRPDMSISFV